MAAIPFADLLNNSLCAHLDKSVLKGRFRVTPSLSRCPLIMLVALRAWVLKSILPSMRRTKRTADDRLSRADALLPSTLLGQIKKSYKGSPLP